MYPSCRPSIISQLSPSNFFYVYSQNAGLWAGVSLQTLTDYLESLVPVGDVTGITYGSSGLSDGKVIAYVLDGYAHTVSYPDATHIVDVGPDSTVTVTLDGSGRPTSRVTT